MKKIMILMAIVFAAAVFTGCDKNDDPVVEAPMYNVQGWWDLTHLINTKGEWEDVTTPLMQIVMGGPTWIRFYENTYQAAGFFGDGKGKYEMKKDVITFYAGTEYFITARIVSLSDGILEAHLYEIDEPNLVFKARFKKE